MTKLATTEQVNVYGVPQPSGFYSIIQIFKPGVTVQLASATSVGANSFTLSAVTGMSVGDLLLIDTDGDSDYLTIESVSGTTVTTSGAARYAHVAGVNVFRPGAFTQTAGTPNLLLDTEIDANTGTSRGAYQVTRKELQQGGLDTATFYLHKSYEDNTDIQFGNWIVYGLEGGLLAADAAAGASSISVTNLYNRTNLTTGLDLLNIQANDPIVISDGINTEIFIASSVSGSGPWTIALSAAPGGTSTLLNSYTAANTVKICRLRYQGIILNRGRTTDRKNQFQIVAVGMFSRYGQVYGNSTASQVDGCTLMNAVLNSYVQTVPEVIVSAANLASASVPVTVSEQDARISQIIADILKQEASMVPSQSSSGLTVTPTAISFLQTSSAPQYARVNGGKAPYSASSSNANVASVTLIGSDAVNTTTLNGNINAGVTSFNVNTTTKTIGITQATSATGSLTAGDLLLLDGGTASAEFVTIASISGSALHLTKPTVYSHASGAAIAQYLSVKIAPGATPGTATITITDGGSLQVTIQVANAVAPQASSGTVWSVWIDALRQVHHNQIPTSGTPTKTLDITNVLNSYGDIVFTLDTTDMDGTNLMNAAIVRGGTGSDGNRVRVLVRDKYSRKLLNAWYEGVLDNPDITDPQQLANWAASQLAILAYPMTSAQLTLASASGRITTQDLVQLTGFTDGSSFIANPIEIDYVDDAEQMVSSATLTLGILKPDVDAIAAEYAGEKSIRETYNVTPTNLGQSGIVAGLGFTQGAGLNFSIAGGTVMYGGVQYNVAACSDSAPENGTSYWGVQIVGGTAQIVQMPTPQAASMLSAQAAFDIEYRGGPAVPSSSFAGVPLYKITASGTAIIGWESIAPLGGINPANIPPVTSGTVSVSNVSLGAYTGQAGTTGIDVTLDVDYTGELSAIGQFKVIAVPHGLATSSQWLWSSSGTWGEGVLRADQITSTSQTVTIAVANMPLGVQLDLYFFVEDIAGLSAVWPSNNPIATTTAQTLSTNAMPKMPAGASFTASGITIWAADPGRHRLSYSASDSLLNPKLSASFTVNETNTPDMQQWVQSGNLYVRPYSASQSKTDKTTYESFPQGNLAGSVTNGTLLTFAGGVVTGGQQYDVAVSITDGQGGETGLVYLGNYTVPKAQNGSPIGPILGIGHFLGDTSGDITTTIVDGGSKRFLHGVMSGGVQGALNAAADAFGKYFKTGAIHRLAIDASNTPGGTNLLYNPTFANGTTGWGRFQNGGANLSWSTDAYSGGRLIATGTLPANGVDLWQQYVSGLFGSQSMVVSGILEASGLAAGVSVDVDFLDNTNQVILGSYTFNTNGAWRQPFAFQITLAANTSSGYVRVQASGGASGGSVTAVVYKLQLEYGSQPSPYVDHNATSVATKVFDGAANILSTAPSKKYVINSLANMLSNITCQFYSASSGSLVAWLTSSVATSKSPGGTGYPGWEYPDNSGGLFPGWKNGYSTVNGTGSSAPGRTASGLLSWTGLGTAGVYILVGYDPTNDWYTVPYGPSTTAPGDDLIASAQGDGTVLVALISASSNTVIKTTGGGAQPIGGGGGTQRQKL